MYGEHNLFTSLLGYNLFYCILFYVIIFQVPTDYGQHLLLYHYVRLTTFIQQIIPPFPFKVYILYMVLIFNTSDSQEQAEEIKRIKSQIAQVRQETDSLLRQREAKQQDVEKLQQKNCEEREGRMMLLNCSNHSNYIKVGQN